MEAILHISSLNQDFSCWFWVSVWHLGFSLWNGFRFGSNSTLSSRPAYLLGSDLPKAKHLNEYGSHFVHYFVNPMSQLLKADFSLKPEIHFMKSMFPEALRFSILGECCQCLSQTKTITPEQWGSLALLSSWNIFFKVSRAQYTCYVMYMNNPMLIEFYLFWLVKTSGNEIEISFF